MRKFSLFLPLLVVAVFSSCTKSTHEHGGHAHKAPHDGTLIELGDHAYNLELVRDTAAGKLTAYVLDGHASEFIRVPVPSFDLVVNSGGEKKSLTFRGVASTTTGETIGNTSQFEAQADWLKNASELTGVIPTIDIRGTKFDNVTVKLPK
jgi:hypothetical protein